MVFRVDNNGPGLDPATFKSVVENFDRDSRAGNEGNGLGLAIAGQAAEKASVAMSVENLMGGNCLTNIVSNA